MKNFLLFLSLIFLIDLAHGQGDSPPLIKGNGESSYKATVKLNMPNTTISRSGATGTLGLLNMTGGGSNKALTAALGGIVYTDSDSMEVLGAGSLGQTLYSFGAAAPAWGNVPVWATPQVSKTTTYTTTSSDGVIYVSGASGAWSLTLHAASSTPNQILIIKRTDNTYANVVSIVGTIVGSNGAETDFKLHTPGETYTIQSDGTNWQLIQHKSDTGWIAFPSVLAGTLITGSTTNPVYGNAGLPTTNAAYWMRRGANVLIRWDYRQTVASLNPGAGNYFLNTPSYLAADSTVKVNTTLGAVPGSGYDSGSIGQIVGGYGATYVLYGVISAYSSTQFKGYLTNSGTFSVWGTTNFDFAINAAAFYSIRLEYPVSGWKP